MVELDGTLYMIGTTYRTSKTLALRKLGDPHANDLVPFPTLGAARRTCTELAQAKVVEFPADAADGRHQRSGLRRRRRRNVPRPDLPLHGPDGTVSEVLPASVEPGEEIEQPAEVPSAAPPIDEGPVSGPAASSPSRRSSSRGSRPTPETMEALDEALDRLETSSP
jgi:hypothetical protein